MYRGRCLAIKIHIYISLFNLREKQEYSTLTRQILKCICFIHSAFYKLPFEGFYLKNGLKTSDLSNSLAIIEISQNSIFVLGQMTTNLKQIHSVKFNCTTTLKYCSLSFHSEPICGTVWISAKLACWILGIIWPFKQRFWSHIPHYSGPENCFFSEELKCLLALVCEPCIPLFFPFILSS